MVNALRQARAPKCLHKCNRLEAQVFSLDATSDNAMPSQHDRRTKNLIRMRNLSPTPTCRLLETGEVHYRRLGLRFECTLADDGACVAQ